MDSSSRNRISISSLVDASNGETPVSQTSYPPYLDSHALGHSKALTSLQSRVPLVPHLAPRPAAQQQSFNGIMSSNVPAPSYAMRTGPVYGFEVPVSDAVRRLHPFPPIQSTSVKGRRGKKHHCNYGGCGKVFTRLSNLKAHWRKHSGYEPYACTYCGRTFKWRSSLKSHENGCEQAGASGHLPTLPPTSSLLLGNTGSYHANMPPAIPRPESSVSSPNIYYYPEAPSDGVSQASSVFYSSASPKY